MSKKRLCKLKDDKVAKELKRLMKVVREPTHICRRRLLATSRRPPRSYAVIPHPSRSSVR